VVFNFITNVTFEFSQKLMSAKPTWIKDLSIQEVFEEFWTIGFGVCHQDLTILMRVSAIHPMDDPNLLPSWPTIHVCWMPKHLAYVPHICSSFSEHPLPRRQQKKKKRLKARKQNIKTKTRKFWEFIWLEAFEHCEGIRILMKLKTKQEMKHQVNFIKKHMHNSLEAHK